MPTKKFLDGDGLQHYDDIIKSRLSLKVDKTQAATDDTIGLVKPGDGLEVAQDGTMGINREEVIAPLTYPSVQINLLRTYRELNRKNHSGLSTYDPDTNGAACVQGGVSTGENTMLFTYWNSDDIDLNENRIVEKDISTGATIKEVEANYGWCNGLTYNPDKGLVYVVPRGTSGSGGARSKDIKVLNYSDLSLVTTITLSTDLTIQSASYENGELWVMGEGAVKFYRISVDDYSILETVVTQIPSSNSTFYYQNFSYHDDKFWVLGSIPQALMVYNRDGSLFKQYTMPSTANRLYNVGEYQFIDCIGDKKFYIGSSQDLGAYNMAQVFLMDLDKGYVEGLGSISETGATGTNLSIKVDSTSTSINPDGTNERPFKELCEATNTPVFDRPIRISIANGTYEYTDVRHLDSLSMAASDTSTPNVTINGMYIREANGLMMYYLKIVDSTITSRTASLVMAYSSATIRGCAVNNTTKYGVYLQDGSILNATRGTTMSTPAKSNVYVNAVSQLEADVSLGITLEKGNISSKIICPMKLFPSDGTMYLGDFPYDAILAAWFTRDRFGFINIDYTFRGTQKVAKFPATLAHPVITDSYTDGSGNTYLGKVYVNIGATKIAMSGNAFVTIANSGGSAVISRTVLSDNASGSSNYIAVKNIYMSDN